jgi:hypothetical protein
MERLISIFTKWFLRRNVDSAMGPMEKQIKRFQDISRNNIDISIQNQIRQAKLAEQNTALEIESQRAEKISKNLSAIFEVN